MAANVGTNPQVAALMSTITNGLGQLNAQGVNVAGGGATAPATGAAGATGATGATGAAGAGASAQKTTIPGTGKAEIRVTPGGATKYYPATPIGQTATEITAFQYTDGQQFQINLDYRDGIATGLANLSRIFGARQERVRLLSNALANDANTTGSFNPVDLQKMSLETTTTQQLSEMQKKIFDSMKDSISAWLR